MPKPVQPAKTMRVKEDKKEKKDLRFMPHISAYCPSGLSYLPPYFSPYLHVILTAHEIKKKHGSFSFVFHFWKGFQFYVSKRGRGFR